jgi:putative FmdB family regulatory protein
VPTYEYRCTSCGHQYEMRQGFDADSRQECPQCGNVAKRLLFPPPIVFKGSGFYVTDSKKGSSVTVPAAEPAADGKKDANGAEAKPAATPAPAAKSESSTTAASSSSSD